MKKRRCLSLAWMRYRKSSGEALRGRIGDEEGYRRSRYGEEWVTRLARDGRAHRVGGLASMDRRVVSGVVGLGNLGFLAQRGPRGRPNAVIAAHLSQQLDQDDPDQSSMTESNAIMKSSIPLLPQDINDSLPQLENRQSSMFVHLRILQPIQHI
ncbi:hypothetical protein Bca4012_054851 [Brassica carinata]